MIICFLINKFETEEHDCTTAVLARTAVDMGHTVWYVEISDFSKAENGEIWVLARIASCASSFEELINPVAINTKKKVEAEKIDVLWNRFDPTEDLSQRSWAPTMGLKFSKEIKKIGKLVVNDPDTLTFNNTKFYLEDFPKHLRPPSIITNSYSDVLAFLDRYKKIILKPLQGSVGKNVFYIDADNRPNLRQIVEVLSAGGYFVAQKYLTEAKYGDSRIYLIDGSPLYYKGHYACMRRVPYENEIRSNIHCGGQVHHYSMTEETITLINDLTPKLKRDGMFLVGLDLVGDKLLEINVNCAGGLYALNTLFDVNFAKPIINLLEEKYKNNKKLKKETAH